jgi:hypothetical protein
MWSNISVCIVYYYYFSDPFEAFEELETIALCSIYSGIVVVPNGFFGRKASQDSTLVWYRDEHFKHFCHWMHAEEDLH